MLDGGVVALFFSCNVYSFFHTMFIANRIASGTQGNWMKSMENLWAKVRSFRLSAMSQLKILIDKMRFRWFFFAFVLFFLETHKSKCRSFFIHVFLMLKKFECPDWMLGTEKKNKCVHTKCTKISIRLRLKPPFLFTRLWRANIHTHFSQRTRSYEQQNNNKKNICV